MNFFYRLCQIYIVVIAPLYSARINIFNYFGVKQDFHDSISVLLAIIYVFSAILMFVLERVVRKDEISDLKSRVSSLVAQKEATKPIIDEYKRRSEIESDRKELANEQKRMKLKKEKMMIEKDIRKGNKDFEDASGLPSFEEEENDES